MDAAGNLYCTTSEGGAFGVGTAFKLGPSGNETLLHCFTGGGDGKNPVAALIMDAARRLSGNAGLCLFSVVPQGQCPISASLKQNSYGVADDPQLLAADQPCLCLQTRSENRFVETRERSSPVRVRTEFLA